MTIKMKVLCVLSAISFLVSTACFSAYAAELLDRASADEEPGTAYEEPTVDPTPGPVTDPTPDPGYESDPNPNPNPNPAPDPSYESDPGYEPDPGYTSENTWNSEPDYNNSYNSEYPGDTTDNEASQFTSSELLNESIFSQEGENEENSFVDYNQYNSSNYVNPYSAIYDDNYVYVPSYTEPEQSLIDTSSKQVNTDELTQDDWAKIMLDLEAGNISDDGTQTFNFIKQNDEVGDTSIAWMLYLGVGLILLSIFLIIYVVISTKKDNRKYAA